MSEPILQINHLSKSFGAHVVLRDIDFTVNSGDVISIIGASGSGKSTLLRSLNMLEKPTGGSIEFHGVDITKKRCKNSDGKTVKVNINEHREKMGMVFQHFNLFPHMTILDNMTLAPIQVKGMAKAEAEAKAMGLLKEGLSATDTARMVGYSDISHLYAEGLDRIYDNEIEI